MEADCDFYLQKNSHVNLIIEFQKNCREKLQLGGQNTTEIYKNNKLGQYHSTFGTYGDDQEC